MRKATIKTRSIAHIGLLAPMLVAAPSAATSQNSSYVLPSSQQVIAFVVQSIDWYRHTSAERQIARDSSDLLFLDDNHSIEAQIVGFSFEFAKTDAALAMRTYSSNNRSSTVQLGDSSSSDLARFVGLQNQNNEANQKAAEEVEVLSRKVAESRGAERARVQVGLGEVQSRLELLHAESNTINDLVQFAQNAAAGQAHNGDLSSKINELAQSVPEASASPSSFGRQPGRDEASSGAINSHDGGIVTLWSAVSSQKGKLRIIEEDMRLTDNLALAGQNMRDPMAQFISRLIQRSAVSTLRTGDIASLAQDKVQLDALTGQLNSLSPAIVALDKQKVLLGVYKSRLAGWQSAALSEYRQSWKRLCVRLVVIALIMGLVIGSGEIARRVAKRHVQDPDRHRRISIAHRLLTSAVVLIVIAVGFASNLSSLATYFGLLTAGVAVALQNVIVASVGYLMLVGKRGIRVGDRIRVSGISGDVIDIGLLQFQVREFNPDTQKFTQHIATFSNSLVFVSPATGLVRFDPIDDEKSTTEAIGAGRHLRSRGSGVTISS